MGKKPTLKYSQIIDYNRCIQYIRHLNKGKFLLFNRELLWLCLCLKLSKLFPDSQHSFSKQTLCLLYFKKDYFKVESKLQNT